MVGKASWGNLKKRLIVAGLGIPALVLGLLYVPYFIQIFLIILGAMIGVEWTLLYQRHKHHLRFLGALTRSLLHPLVLAYILLPLFYLLQLTGENVAHVVIASLVVVWLTDSGGFFIGKTVGGPLLAPRISPRKTWSGAIGGLACAVLGGFFLTSFLPQGEALLIVCLMSCFGQVGDLVESKFKRMLQVKDSGSFLPGHGGLFDRFDSFIGAIYGYASYCGAFKWVAGHLLSS
ncbi:phosphatidate cytidylyltransferase [Alphaproteobacteria bacterium]|nr:phosphatidate cytidylyltransferase [Alphaproteobacteria bacterium]